MRIRIFSSSNQTILKGPALSDTNNTMIQLENFGPGEPNNHASAGKKGEDCVYAHTNGDWNDANCHAKSEYICEKTAPARPSLNPISNITENPTTIPENPITITENPTTIPENPTTITENPTTITENSTTIADNPTTILPDDLSSISNCKMGFHGELCDKGNKKRQI